MSISDRLHKMDLPTVSWHPRQVFRLEVFNSNLVKLEIFHRFLFRGCGVFVHVVVVVWMY